MEFIIYMMCFRGKLLLEFCLLLIVFFLTLISPKPATAGCEYGVVLCFGPTGCTTSGVEVWDYSPCQTPGYQYGNYWKCDTQPEARAICGSSSGLCTGGCAKKTGLSYDPSYFEDDNANDVCNWVYNYQYDNKWYCVGSNNQNSGCYPAPWECERFGPYDDASLPCRTQYFDRCEKVKDANACAATTDGVWTADHPCQWYETNQCGPPFAYPKGCNPNYVQGCRNYTNITCGQGFCDNICSYLGNPSGDYTAPSSCNKPCPSPSPASTGTLSGVVTWNSNDTDCSGTTDTGKTPNERYVQDPPNVCSTQNINVPGVTISYRNNAGGPTNTLSPNLCSGTQPYFSKALSPGTYTVSVNAPAGWKSLSSSQNITITTGQTKTYQAKICPIPPTCAISSGGARDITGAIGVPITFTYRTYLGPASGYDTRAKVQGRVNKNNVDTLLTSTSTCSDTDGACGADVSWTPTAGGTYKVFCQGLNNNGYNNTVVRQCRALGPYIYPAEVDCWGTKDTCPDTDCVLVTVPGPSPTPSTGTLSGRIYWNVNDKDCSGESDTGVDNRKFVQYDPNLGADCNTNPAFYKVGMSVNINPNNYSTLPNLCDINDRPYYTKTGITQGSYTVSLTLPVGWKAPILSKVARINPGQVTLLDFDICPIKPGCYINGPTNIEVTDPPTGNVYTISAYIGADPSQAAIEYRDVAVRGEMYKNNNATVNGSPDQIRVCGSDLPPGSNKVYSRCESSSSFIPAISDAGKTIYIYCQGYNVSTSPYKGCRPFDYTWPIDADCDTAVTGTGLGLLNGECLGPGTDCMPVTVTKKPKSGWFQTGGGDVHGNLVGTWIPTLTCLDDPMDPDDCQPYFSLATTQAPAGIASAPTFYGNINSRTSKPIPGQRVVNSTENLVSTAFGPNNIKYDYNYYYNKLGIPVTSQPYNGGKPTESGIYYTENDIVFGNGPSDPTSNWVVKGGNDPKWFIIVIDGTLTIRNEITVEPGGFLAFIVKGDIVLDKNIGQNPVSNPSSLKTIEGVYITNGTFDSENVDRGQATDKAVGANGIFIAKGGFNLTRNLGNINNEIYPGEYFGYRPDFLVTAPRDLSVRQLTWREVAP